MGERLADGNVGIALLANTGATGAMLFVLITIFGPISGAHFNPAVSAVAALQRNMTWTLCVAYIAAQIAGALVGVAAAHAMFELPIAQISLKERSGHCAAVQRIRRDVRFDHYDNSDGSLRTGACRSGGCELHHGRLLVHCIDFFRQSRGDRGPLGQRYVRGYSAE